MAKGKGKKDKKPVCPPGMSMELFTMSQDVQVLVAIFKGNLIQLKEKPPVQISKGQAGTFLWQHALTSKAKRDEMVGLMIWSAAVSNIVHGDRLDQTPAVGILQSLSAIEELRVDVAMARCTVPCMSLLGGSSPTSELYACWTLRNLAETPDSRKKVVRDISDWAPLVRVLVESTNGQSRGEAARILELCAKHGEESPHTALAVQDALAECGAVNNLITMMQVDWLGPGPRGAAVCALRILAPREENKAEIVRVGGIQLMVELLTSGIELQAKAAAAEVLWHLTAMTEERLPMRKPPRASVADGAEGEEAGGGGAEGEMEVAIEDIRPSTAASMVLPTGEVGLFTSVEALERDIPARSDPVREGRIHAAVVVGAIGHLVGLCAGPAGIPPLVMRPVSTPDSGKKKGKKGGGKKKGKKGKEPPLPPGMVECQRWASGCLRHLSLSQSYQHEMVEAGAVRVLVPLLATKVPETRWSATILLWTLGVDAENALHLHGAVAPKHFHNHNPMRPVTAPVMGLAPRPGAITPVQPLARPASTGPSAGGGGGRLWMSPGSPPPPRRATSRTSCSSVVQCCGGGACYSN